MAEFILFSSYPIFALIVGLVIGSFLNVVIYRLPLMVLAHYEEETTTGVFNLWWPPSHCPECDKPILKRDNIPVFSWLWLKEMPVLRNRYFRPVSDIGSDCGYLVYINGIAPGSAYQRE